MPFLKEYALKLKKLGEPAYVAQQRIPVLLGLGIAGALPTKMTGPGTMQVDGASLLENLTWTQRVFELKPGPDSNSTERLSVGRTTSNTDITINDFTISREQCAFVVAKDGVTIIDLGSRNGTTVSDQRLANQQRRLLVGGEIVQLGRLQFQFFTAEGFLARVKEFDLEDD